MTLNNQARGRALSSAARTRADSDVWPVAIVDQAPYAVLSTTLVDVWPVAIVDR